MNIENTVLFNFFVIQYFHFIAFYLENNMKGRI